MNGPYLFYIKTAAVKGALASVSLGHLITEKLMDETDPQAIRELIGC